MLFRSGMHLDDTPFKVSWLIPMEEGDRADGSIYVSNGVTDTPERRATGLWERGGIRYQSSNLKTKESTIVFNNNEGRQVHTFLTYDDYMTADMARLENAMPDRKAYEASLGGAAGTEAGFEAYEVSGVWNTLGEQWRGFSSRFTPSVRTDRFYFAAHTAPDGRQYGRYDISTTIPPISSISRGMVRRSTSTSGPLPTSRPSTRSPAIFISVRPIS